jgi:hypothetical protein
MGTQVAQNEPGSVLRFEDIQPMLPYFLVALILAVAVIIRLSDRNNDLKDLILWYRRALADREVDWQEVEGNRLALYKLEPELRPLGVYRQEEGVSDMKFVEPDEAQGVIARATASYHRFRSRHLN